MLYTCIISQYFSSFHKTKQTKTNKTTNQKLTILITIIILFHLSSGLLNEKNKQINKQNQTKQTNKQGEERIVLSLKQLIYLINGKYLIMIENSHSRRRRTRMRNNIKNQNQTNKVKERIVYYLPGLREIS